MAKKKAQKIEVEFNVAGLAAEVNDLRRLLHEANSRLRVAEARLDRLETPATNPNRPWYVRYICG